ncbi:penicillin-binding transpeptidase domain-containing protein [Anaerocolumna sp. MB42-C2]|uniref:penicillin-binding transpeptidase domain-containing protein n=1 Tax=Anaerocolumna sp. MB42-C2 TaxID=3070997 RepID=UPI0027E05CA9|nr:penicillin-binding transpeptidase domain-containing protein [Anaerocolumna sp. MB42-C2]WMJ86422.1 penicillin-binding transpeptidase domain-containing protein [Anaerocolumna sp. MB42-C2]
MKRYKESCGLKSAGCKKGMVIQVKCNIGIRLGLVTGVMAVMFLILIGRLYQLQILNGTNDTQSPVLKTEKEIIVKSARGNIFDRNGKPLAYNKLAYTLTLKDTGDYKTNRIRQLTLNSVAYKLINILKINKETLNNDLIINLNETGNYEFTEGGMRLNRFKADIFGKVKAEDMTEAEKAATPEDMIKYLESESKFCLYGERTSNYSMEELQKYGLKAHYSKEETLGILGLRYMLSLNTFQKYMPITVSKDVSEKTMIYVKENSSELVGADIDQEWLRIYDGGEAFAHVLGYTGKISSEELERLKEKDSDYMAESVVGKTGIEQYMEETLKGHNGISKGYINNSGKFTEVAEDSKKPVPGQDVYLSIDKELQIAVYNILEQHIAGILYSNIINAKEFDKKSVKDASDIKIPVYDVYFALVNNEIIDLRHLNSKTATGFEKNIYKKLLKEKETILSHITGELTEGTQRLKDLSPEMQEYERFITSKLDIINNTAVDKEDSAYISWTEKNDITIKEFFAHALKSGWIDTEKLSSNGKYFTMEETYQVLAEEIKKELEQNTEFDKIIFKYLLLRDVIPGQDICRLLYEQGVLSKKDTDYETLINHNISAYEFIRKKIDSLEITPSQLALDPYSGSAVIVEAGTGKVLACVTYPGYDNNRMANQMDSGYYNKLYKDLSMPFYNRATQQLTAPGSTFKPITVIAGLNEQVITPYTSIFCDGIFDKVTPPLRCWKHFGHGEIINPAAAIENSCNDYLCDISYRLGMKERTNFSDPRALYYLKEYASLFGLDQKSGIEISESTPHISDSYAIPSAIGQGTHNFTTVQLARYVNTLAEKGISYKLSLIDGIKNSNSEEIVKKASEIQKRIKLSGDIWNVVSQGMKQFADSNEVLKDLKMDIAGKTGTAQESNVRPDHALFVCYAPADNPEITVAVRIANGYASGNAVGVGKDIINYYFGLEKEEDIVIGKASPAYNVRTD